MADKEYRVNMKFYNDNYPLDSFCKGEDIIDALTKLLDLADEITPSCIEKLEMKIYKWDENKE